MLGMTRPVLLGVMLLACIGTAVAGEPGVRHPFHAAQAKDAPESVVLAAGMWGREFGAAHGVSLPLQAAEHFYAVTEPIPGLQPSMPFIRVPDESTYYKEDAGKLLFGCL